MAKEGYNESLKKVRMFVQPASVEPVDKGVARALYDGLALSVDIDSSTASPKLFRIPDGRLILDRSQVRSFTLGSESTTREKLGISVHDVVDEATVHNAIVNIGKEGYIGRLHVGGRSAIHTPGKPEDVDLYIGNLTVGPNGTDTIQNGRQVLPFDSDLDGEVLAEKKKQAAERAAAVVEEGPVAPLEPSPLRLLSPREELLAAGVTGRRDNDSLPETITLPTAAAPAVTSDRTEYLVLQRNSAGSTRKVLISTAAVGVAGLGTVAVVDALSPDHTQTVAKNVLQVKPSPSPLVEGKFVIPVPSIVSPELTPVTPTSQGPDHKPEVRAPFIKSVGTEILFEKGDGLWKMVQEEHLDAFGTEASKYETALFDLFSAHIGDTANPKPGLRKIISYYGMEQFKRAMYDPEGNQTLKALIADLMDGFPPKTTIEQVMDKKNPQFEGKRSTLAQMEAVLQEEIDSHDDEQDTDWEEIGMVAT